MTVISVMDSMSKECADKAEDLEIASRLVRESSNVFSRLSELFKEQEELLNRILMIIVEHQEAKVKDVFTDEITDEIRSTIGELFN